MLKKTFSYGLTFLRLPRRKPFYRCIRNSFAAKLFLSLFILLSGQCLAQESGLTLLTTGPGSHALGLNEAVTAELLGASNLYSNPANLALEPSSSLNANYTLWIAGQNHAHAAVNLRKNNRGLAFGFTGSQTDDIALRGDRAGPAQGSFSISLLSLSAGYGYKLGPIALGSSIQYLREDYYTDEASGYAINLGAATFLWNKRLQLGTALLNLGEMSELNNEATNLPTAFRAGFSAELFTVSASKNEDFPITVYLKNDWVFPLNTSSQTTQTTNKREVYTNIAVALDIADTIMLRSGYKTDNTARHWTAGAGITVGSIVANYAIIPFENGFGTVHSLGLRYRF